jgi:hypothetical protein
MKGQKHETISNPKKKNPIQSQDDTVAIKKGAWSRRQD